MEITKQRANIRYQNAVNNAQGHHFEQGIQGACKAYREDKRAEIDKTPEPFRVMEKSQNGIFKGRFTAHASPDFQGTLSGGQSIVFEAKYTTKERMNRNVLTLQQTEALERHALCGGMTAVCIGITDKYYFIPWHIWRDMKRHFGRQYVTPEDIENSLYPKYTENTAYGFLTRGCPRNCPFCIVSIKEGRVSKKVADLGEFWSGEKNIKLLDPNLLACKEHMELLYQLAASGAWADFTQGLDARYINEGNVKLLGEIKVKMVHFAFDLMKHKKQTVQGLQLYKESTGIDERKTGVYILTNYNTTHKEDLYRAELVRDMGYMPYIMIYQKNTAAPITRRLQRWANNRFIYMASGKRFENYNKKG